MTIELFIGAAETYTFACTDAAGAALGDGVSVELRVQGVGTFAASGTGGQRTVELTDADTGGFTPGVYHAQLIADEESGDRLIERVLIAAQTMIADEED